MCAHNFFLENCVIHLSSHYFYLNLLYYFQLSDLDWWYSLPLHGLLLISHYLTWFCNHFLFCFCHSPRCPFWIHLLTSGGGEGLTVFKVVWFLGFRTSLVFFSVFILLYYISYKEILLTVIFIFKYLLYLFFKPGLIQ